MPRKRHRLDTLRLQPPPPPPATASSMELVLDDGDLLTEILLRLPAKSLIKSKSVSKKWFSLISSDRFCHRHTLRRPKLQHSLILQMAGLDFFYLNQTINGEYNITSYTLGVPGHHQIVQDCNGLLLLLLRPRKYSHYTYNPTSYESQTNLLNSYCIYNPATRRSRMISLNSSDSYPCVAAVNLAFDPSESPYYKVVCVRSGAESNADRYHHQGLTHLVEVYDSESHTWKVAPVPFTTIDRISHGVHCKGAIYWWTTCNGGAFSCFDIARNETRSLLAPPDVYSEPHDSFPYYQESDGHLYHFDILETERGVVSIALWELKGNDHDDYDNDDDSPWLLKYLDGINTNGVDDPVRLMGGSERCSLLTHHRDRRKIMAHNFLDKSYEEVVDLTRQPHYLPCYQSMKGFQFGEVLALV